MKNNQKEIIKKFINHIDSWGSIDYKEAKALLNQIDDIKDIKDGGNRNVLHLLNWLSKNNNGEGFHELCDELMKRNGIEVLINACNTDGTTPIYQNTAHSDVYFVKKLIEHGAKLNILDKANNNVLHSICSKDSTSLEYFDAIIKHQDFKELINNINNDGKTPLFLAFQKLNHDKKFDKIKLLVDNGADLKQTLELIETDTQNNILHILMAKYSDNKLIEMVLDHESCPDINALNKNSASPLNIAIKNSNFSSFDFLIEKGAKIDESTFNPFDNNENPFHKLARNAYTLDSLKLLAQNEFSKNYIDQKNKDGKSPLEIAINSCNFKYINFFKDNGVNWVDTIKNFKAKNEGNIFHQIFEESYSCNKELFKEIAQTFRDLINQGNNQGLTPIIAGLKKDNYSFVEMLIENGADLESKDDNGANIIHYLIPNYSYASEVKQKLFDKIVSHDSFKKLINCPNNNGSTPLLSAISKNQSVFANTLITNGASIDCITKSGDNIFHLLAKSQIENEELLNKIFKSNLSSDAFTAENENGETPISIAVTNCNFSVTELLAENGVSLNFKTKNGDNAFHLIASSRDSSKKLIKLLIKKLPIELLNEVNNEKKSPIDIAVTERDTKLLDCLIEKKFVFKESTWQIKSYNSNNLLHLTNKMSISSENWDFILNQLKNYDFKDEIINAKNDDEETPLYLALKNEASYKASGLLENGAQIDKKILEIKNFDSYANNLLHILVKNKISQQTLKNVIKQIQELNPEKLIEYIKHENNFGNTPIFAALENKNFTAIIELNEELGNKFDFLTCIDSNGNSVLHLMAINTDSKNVDMCLLLMKYIIKSHPQLINHKNKYEKKFWSSFYNLEVKNEVLMEFLDKLDLIDNNSLGLSYLSSEFLPVAIKKLTTINLIELIKKSDIINILENKNLEYYENKIIQQLFYCAIDSEEKIKALFDFLIENNCPLVIFQNLLRNILEKDTFNEGETQIVKYCKETFKDQVNNVFEELLYSANNRNKIKKIISILDIMDIEDFEILDKLGITKLDKLCLNGRTNDENFFSTNDNPYKELKNKESFISLLKKHPKLLSNLALKIKDKYLNQQDLKMLNGLTELMKIFMSIDIEKNQDLTFLGITSIKEYIKKHSKTFDKFKELGFLIPKNPSKPQYKSEQQKKVQEIYKYFTDLEHSCKKIAEKIDFISESNDNLSLYEEILKVSVINEQDEQGRTHLMNLVSKIKFFEFLLKNGADVGIKELTGNNIFHFIASNGSIDAYNILGKYVNIKEYINIKNDSLLTPIEVALKDDRIDFASFILKDVELNEKVRKNFVDKVEYFLSRQDLSDEIIQNYFNLAYQEELTSSNLIDKFKKFTIKNGLKICKLFFNEKNDEIFHLNKGFEFLINKENLKKKMLSKQILECVNKNEDIKEALYVVDPNLIEHDKNDNDIVKSILDCFDILNFRLVDPKINPEKLLMVLEYQLKTLSKESLTKLNDLIYKTHFQNAILNTLENICINSNIENSLKAMMLELIFNSEENIDFVNKLKNLGFNIPNKTNHNSFIKEIEIEIDKVKIELAKIQELYKQVNNECTLALYKHILLLNFKEVFSEEFCNKAYKVFELDQQDNIKFAFENLLNSISPKVISNEIVIDRFEFEKNEFLTKFSKIQNKTIKMLIDEISNITDFVGDPNKIKEAIENLKLVLKNLPFFGLQIDILNMPIMTAEFEIVVEEGLEEANKDEKDLIIENKLEEDNLKDKIEMVIEEELKEENPKNDIALIIKGGLKEDNPKGNKDLIIENKSDLKPKVEQNLHQKQIPKKSSDMVNMIKEKANNFLNILKSLKITSSDNKEFKNNENIINSNQSTDEMEINGENSSDDN